MKQQVTISLDTQVVEKLDSHARNKRQKRGEAVEALLCERFGIILIRDKVALNLIKEKDEEIASLQNQLNAALAEIEAAKKKAEPRSIGVVKQLPLNAGRSGSSLDSDRFTMEGG
jgi:metal-responsive CopG/Arc/MetJ family transcriptional regulator